VAQLILNSVQVSYPEPSSVSKQLTGYLGIGTKAAIGGSIGGAAVIAVVIWW